MMKVANHLLQFAILKIAYHINSKSATPCIFIRYFKITAPERQNQLYTVKLNRIFLHQRGKLEIVLKKLHFPVFQRNYNVKPEVCNVAKRKYAVSHFGYPYFTFSKRADEFFF